MTLDMTTEQIAAHVRRTNRAHPRQADITRVPADAFAAMLQERLPGVDPADIAAVLLHTGSYLVTVIDAFRKGGVDEHRATVSAINIVAHAGERIGRKALRGEASPLRTPDQWCALYGVEVHDPDGWRRKGAPAWDEPVGLVEFWERASASTLRNAVGDEWARVSRDAVALVREQEGGKP